MTVRTSIEKKKSHNQMEQMMHLLVFDASGSSPRQRTERPRTRRWLSRRSRFILIIVILIVAVVGNATGAALLTISESWRCSHPGSYWRWRTCQCGDADGRLALHCRRTT